MDYTHAKRAPTLRPLLLCGAASAALYSVFVCAFPLLRSVTDRDVYDLMDLTGHDVRGAIGYGVLVIALFGLYQGAWRLLERQETSTGARSRSFLAIVIGFGVLFALVLVWMYPINATDLFQYFFRSRIFVLYGCNPLFDTPGRFFTDPYLYLVGEWTDIASPYGPVWELLAGGVAWATGGKLLPNLLALKSMAVLFYAGGVVLVYKILGQLAPERRLGGTLLFAWNPLILFQWIGNGHNDVVMLFFILLGIWLWARKRMLWVLPALTAAVLVKMIAVIVIPLFVLSIWLEKPNLRARLRWIVLTVPLSAAIWVLLFAPFGPLGQNFSGILDEAATRVGFSFAATVALVVIKGVVPFLARSASWSLEALQNLANLGIAVPRWLTLGGLAVSYLWQLGKVWRKRGGPVAAGAEAFFAYLILAPSYRMWYPAWSMPLTALRPTRGRLLRVGAACLTAELSVLIYGYLWPWGTMFTHLVGPPFTLLLPLLLPLLDRWIRRRKSGMRDGDPT